MKNTFKTILPFCISISLAYSQKDVTLIQSLNNNFSNTDVYELIFMENELIQLCSDTSFKNKFSKKINRYFKFTSDSLQNCKYFSNKLASSILANRIKSTSTKNSIELANKNYLLENLKKFQINRKLTLEDVLYLFDGKNWDLANKEVCDSGIIEYLIFIYNQDLYFKAKKNKDTAIKFPVKCILQDYDRNMLFRSQIQNELLKFIDKLKNKDLIKIRIQINNTKITETNW